MKPGALGELIAPEGISGNFEWSSGPNRNTTEVWEGSEPAMFVARFYHQDQALRLERVAAFIGYLQDEQAAQDA